MKTLSQAGRTTLISSVASSIPSYQASSLFLPKQVCNKLDAMNKNFWWGSKEENKRGSCLKSWDSICTPKSVGGLGIKKTEDMNKALVAKMTWEVASNVDKMWVRVFKKKYVRSKKFMKLSMPKAASWSCQSIFGGREVIKKKRIMPQDRQWIEHLDMGRPMDSK